VQEAVGEAHEEGRDGPGPTLVSVCGARSMTGQGGCVEDFVLLL